MGRSNQIKCIFCLKMKSPSDEHVIPKSLGGNLTIKCVCKECNEGLSQLDQSLADSSLLMLPRIMQQPNANWGRSALLSTDHGELLEIKMGHPFQAEMKTQLIFTPKTAEGEYTVRGSSESYGHYEEFFNILQKQIEKKGLEQIKILSSIENTENGGPGFRLVLSRGEVVFRPSKNASTKEEFAAMVQLLERKLDAIKKLIIETAKSKTEQKIEQPNIIFNLSHDFGHNLRAVSKIAYTFLASTYGCEFVVTAKFDDLRNYILTGAGADDKGCIWWNGDENEKSLGSSRFAIWLKDHEKQIFRFGSPETHAISIIHQKDRYVIFIEFYGQVTFAVDVGNAEIPLDFPLVHEFDYQSRKNRIVPMLEVAQRFAEKLTQSQNN